MARNRLLVDLLTDVCDRADVVNSGSNPGRFTEARLVRYINQAIQRYVTIVTGAGGQEFYLKRTGPLVMSTSATRDAAGWAPNMYVPLPSDFFELIGVTVTIGSSTYQLQDFEQAERNAYQESPWWLSGNGLGQPTFYRVGGTDTAGNNVLALIPWTNSAYSYEILYIPEMADLAMPSGVFDGRAGFEEYVVDRAALDVLLKDGSTNVELREELKRDLSEMEKAMAFKFATMAGPGRRLDTEARRVQLGRFARGFWV